MSFFDRFKPPQPKRIFSAWQVELTTRCPLRCLMCPRLGEENWQGRDMRFADFQTLRPYFRQVETVVLEGWGESLLHPHLIDAIRLAKEEGARVGFVTSGQGLNRSCLSALVAAGVDFIGFSFAGARRETHNGIRVNSDLDELIGNIEILNEIKLKEKIRRPKIHLIYLMLKDNIAEIPLLPGLAKTLAMEEVVLTNLIHQTTPWQTDQGVFSLSRWAADSPFLSREGFAPFGRLIEETRAAARGAKIPLKYPRLTPANEAVCEENPLKNLYISTDGEVSPCVYLHPPVASPFRRFYAGQKIEIPKPSLGNIFREPFWDIWRREGYVRFREAFSAREAHLGDMQRGLLKREGLARLQQSPLPEAPPECLTCHKLLGL